MDYFFMGGKVNYLFTIVNYPCILNYKNVMSSYCAGKYSSSFKSQD